MLIALGLAAALIVSDPDGLVTTAPAGPGAVLIGAEAPVASATPDPQATAITPHNLTTQQQIDRWLAARSPEVDPFADDSGPLDDRQVHGYVSGSIGSNDFSAVEVGVSLPVGENGRVELTYEQVRNGYGYFGRGYGYGYPSDRYDDRYALGADPSDLDPWNAPAPFYGPGWSHAGHGYQRRGPRTGFGLSYQSRSDRGVTDRPPR